MDVSRRNMLRGSVAAGAVAWSTPAIAGVHVARAQTSGPIPGHAISFVGIVYRTLGGTGATTHLMKAEFQGGGGDPFSQWLIETDGPKLPSCAPPADASTYLPGDASVIDPGGPLAGAEPPASFAHQLDEDDEPFRVVLGIAGGHELVSVFVKCGTDCVGVLAGDLDRTFDGKYIVENCATYLQTIE